MDIQTIFRKSYDFVTEWLKKYGFVRTTRRLIEYNFDFADYLPENQQYIQNLIDQAYNRAGKEDNLRFTFSNASLSNGRYRQRSNG
ncbi:hypothetical protein NPIL_697611 [Nephila pilipes]|uniref:Uncharacterized protein n=1 Tax=Nephila pilipes TaxID=299642 RepID=A0A8X6MPE6_NEPPI|nr:hypothetical protein NPIL_697611 [Nephila pilipes]